MAGSSAPAVEAQRSKMRPFDIKISQFSADGSPLPSNARRNRDSLSGASRGADAEDGRDAEGGPVRSQKKSSRGRERVRIELAPDQPPTTQGKQRERVYVACLQWCVPSSTSIPIYFINFHSSVVLVRSAAMARAPCATTAHIARQVVANMILFPSVEDRTGCQVVGSVREGVAMDGRLKRTMATNLTGIASLPARMALSPRQLLKRVGKGRGG